MDALGGATCDGARRVGASAVVPLRASCRDAFLLLRPVRWKDRRYFMDLSVSGKLREKLSGPINPAALELIVGLTLALWTFFRIVLVHSSLASSYWVGMHKPMQYVQAIVLGSLITTIACKWSSLKVPSVALLFCLLLSSLTAWRMKDDLAPLALALFLVASRGMSLRRLARYYVAALAAALAAAMLLVCAMRVRHGEFSPKDALLLRYGFEDQYVIAIGIFSALSAAAMIARSSRSKRVLVVVCVLCAVVAFVSLHAKRMAIFMLALAACVYFGERRRAELLRLLSRREVRMTLAVLPVVLFCASNDLAKFYSFNAGRSGYTMLAPTFGYLFAACLGVMHARATLARRCLKGNLLVFTVAILYTLLLLFEAQPVYLEFNYSLLLLGLALDWGGQRGAEGGKNHFPE